MNGKPKSYRSFTAMSELYARYDYLMALEGPFRDELPDILSGGATLGTPDDPFQMPEVEAATDWQGHLALIAPREGGRVFAFDGFIHLDRSKTGIYMESGEITREEIERMRAGEGPLQVDFFGTTEITAEMAFRQTAGRVQPDVSACILVRPAANPGTAVPFPSCDQFVIGLAGSEPTVVTPEDFRNTLRWQLETHAARYGRSIPPDELESMVDELERRVQRDSCQMELGEDDPLRHQLQTVGRRQRALGLIGRNDYCPCGSGKKFKKCCYNKN
jgi:SEC-C motif